jgi:4-hydroxy-tetrahydrodipicolinate synthase
MFKGSIPALVTPFTETGAVDEASFAAHVEWVIAEGSHGVVPVGTTGESPTLSHGEHKRVVELCIEVAAKRVPVIAGAGSNNTREAIELAQHAEKVGADAILVVTPYYNKPTQKGLIAHFKAIAEAVSLPIVIYNIPGRSVVDMSPETMGALAHAHKNIIGVKDATGKIERVSEQRGTCGKDFVQLSGEDATALGFNAHGGVGCISVTAKCRAAPLRRVSAGNTCRRLCQGARLPGQAHAAAQGYLHGTRRLRCEIRAEQARPHEPRGPFAPAADPRAFDRGRHGCGAQACRPDLS